MSKSDLEGSSASTIAPTKWAPSLLSSIVQAKCSHKALSCDQGSRLQQGFLRFWSAVAREFKARPEAPKGKKSSQSLFHCQVCQFSELKVSFASLSILFILFQEAPQLLGFELINEPSGSCLRAPGKLIVFWILCRPMTLGAVASLAMPCHSPSTTMWRPKDH